jgi:hypothetical protein
MSVVAVIGAGPIGGALSFSLALAEACTDVLVVDDSPAMAEGKTLDVLQACPVAASDTRVRASSRHDPIVDADVIVVADRAADGTEWQSEAGLVELSRVLVHNPRAAVVFAGAFQDWLLHRSVIELSRARTSVVGTCALAVEASARALTALEADRAACDVELAIEGRPPRAFSVRWHSGLIAGHPALDVLEASAIRRVDSRLPALWPPGPYALASAAAAVVRAMLEDRRAARTCLVVPEDGGSPVAARVRLGREGLA